MTDNTKKAHRGDGRVAFLARLDDFQRLLDAGHPLKAIYEEHQDALGIGYPQFTKYVGRFIRKADHDRHQTKGSGNVAPPLPVEQHGGSIQPPAQPAQPTGGTSDAPKFQGKPTGKFTHDASGGNKRNDLI